MKTITSRDNPTFKLLRQVAEEPREQRRTGRTLIDGPHLVEAYRTRVGLPAMIVVSESGLSGPQVARLIEAHQGLEPLLLRDALFRELSGTASPVGILAVIDIPAESSSRIEGSCVLLDGVQDSGNVGAILRSTAAAGIRDVFLGPGCAGAWTPRVLRAAQGAHFNLRIREQAALAAIIRDYSGRTLAAVAHGGTPLYSMDLRGEVAWLFGSEGKGISAALLLLVDADVTIPLAGHNESLNVAAAAAVCLFEAVRQRRGSAAG